MQLYSKAARLVILDFFTWVELMYLVLKLGSVLLSVKDTFFLQYLSMTSSATEQPCC